MTARMTRQLPVPGAASCRASARRLLKTYAQLAKEGRHLLDDILERRAPAQWAHYPENDARDDAHGYQWFYHSHSPEDRLGAQEHGHLHLFARRQLWQPHQTSDAERAFAAMTGYSSPDVDTRHLLAIGINPKGIPVSLFTVNSWVTGDPLLSAALTERLIQGIKLDTGHAAIDNVITSTLALFSEDLPALLLKRDQLLANHADETIEQKQQLDILSEIHIDVDAKLAACLC